MSIKLSPLTGKLLVALQFILIFLLIWLSEPVSSLGGGDLLVWSIAVIGTIAGLLAIKNNPPGNFNIEPMPKSGGRLIQSGIYKYIRHPMYTSVSLFGLMCVTATPSIFTWVVFGLLLGILHMKALMEESWMLLAHAEYASYMKYTKRYLPLIF